MPPDHRWKAPSAFVQNWRFRYRPLPSGSYLR
ncbi:hypothetical protein [Bifidobacterium bombi]